MKDVVRPTDLAIGRCGHGAIEPDAHDGTRCDGRVQLPSRAPNRSAWFATAALLALAAPAFAAGPYSTHSNDPTNPYDAPIETTDPRIVGWATSVIDYAPTPDVAAGHDIPANALGAPTGITVSLGDLTETQIANSVPPGSITLRFAGGIRNGVGHDFAIFENGLAFLDEPMQLFAELAYVEVSSDGVNFARFDSISLQLEEDLYTPFGRDFAGVDSRNYYNLAGKHAAGWGTPFDLEELTAHALVLAGDLDLDDVQYVRLIDVPGDGSFLDSLGNPIYDTWYGEATGGLDLDAIGVINAVHVPEPASAVLLALGAAMLIVRRRNK